MSLSVLPVRLPRATKTLTALAVLTASRLAFAVTPTLKVAATPSFFNPTLGQAATISCTTGAAGTLTLEILDRDGFVIRHLPPKKVKSGPVILKWDGRDDRGETVPNESYTPRLTFSGAAGKSVYDPMAGFTPTLEEPAQRSYASTEGTLTYVLARPSRVHIQAGEAIVDPVTKKSTGPILKTVVDREPRVAGSVAEKWNGFDAGGTINVTQLPNVVLSIVATSLPENSVITVGSRGQSFLDYIRKHRTAADLAPRPLPTGGHAHHHGLRSIEDTSPVLTLTTGGKWDTTRRLWMVDPKTTVTVQVPQDRAPYFMSAETQIDLFLDGKPLRTLEKATNPTTFSLEALPAGEHRLVANWSTPHGPVGVNATRVLVSEPLKTAGSTR